MGKTTNELRDEYRAIRRRSHAENKAAFDAAVAELLGGPLLATAASPELWVKAARAAAFPCRRCAGTGRFVTGSVNGKLVGPGGVCFRCGGRGRQDDADARRNYGADMHAFRDACGAMMAPRAAYDVEALCTADGEYEEGN